MSKELARKKGGKKKGEDDDQDSEDDMELSDEEVNHLELLKDS